MHQKLSYYAGPLNPEISYLKTYFKGKNAIGMIIKGIHYSVFYNV